MKISARSAQKRAPAPSKWRWVTANGVPMLEMIDQGQMDRAWVDTTDDDPCLTRCWHYGRKWDPDKNWADDLALIPLEVAEALIREYRTRGES